METHTRGNTARKIGYFLHDERVGERASCSQKAAVRRCLPVLGIFKLSRQAETPRGTCNKTHKPSEEEKGERTWHKTWSRKITKQRLHSSEVKGDA
jgi:hypothetical protein